MPERRVGLWLIGALGGVGSTVALGLAALRRGHADTTGLVTALPMFAGLDLDQPGQFVLGGHDIRTGSFGRSVRTLAQRTGAFAPTLLDACADDLEEWAGNVRPGVLLSTDDVVAGLADRPDLPRWDTSRLAAEAIQRDLRDFVARNRLDQVAVLNVASTEPAPDRRAEHTELAKLQAAIGRPGPAPMPASAVYAYAAVDLGWPFVNFTPSCGADLPAIQELAARRGAALAGKDGKTGETLVKTVLAPMFARRNLRVLSWVGHNILGNLDGRVLNDPRNKASKVRSKEQVVSGIVGYPVQTHTSIEYIESLDDWKTAWDHVHFQGFLGVRMSLQFTWQGCDSALAAPLVIDLARLALLAQRRKESGVLSHLACFFKSPMGCVEHDFFRQLTWLDEYVQTASEPAS